MMEKIPVKCKISLSRKEETAEFSFSAILKVKFLWKSHNNLDFCLFFKKKDGAVGGVFSSEFRGRKSDLGSLTEFPYMLHLEDKAVSENKDELLEQINITNLNEIEEAYVCVVNYDAAVNEKDVTFVEEGGRVELQSDSGDYLEVIADSADYGFIYCVCTIKNNNGVNSLKKCGCDDEHPEVMDLSTAFEKIPGFKLICNC